MKDDLGKHLHAIFHQIDLGHEQRLLETLPQLLDEHYMNFDSSKFRDPLELIRIERLASLLDVSRPKIYDLIDDKKIIPIKLGESTNSPVRFQRIEVEKLIENHKIY